MNSFSALVRAGLFCVAAAAIPLSTGCGMDVGVSGSTSTGGPATGSGGSCSSGNTSSAVGGSEQTGTGGSAVSSSSGGFECEPGYTLCPDTCVPTNECGMCGGIAGIQCAADQFCDFPTDSCGNADQSGTCKPRPMACDASYSPTCGCDGQIYGSACTANSAGHDVASAGTCTTPVGMFACGPHFCDQKTQYCQRVLSDVSNWPDDFGCIALPSGCLVTPSCACLGAEPCANTCQTTSDGGLNVTCPGG